MPVSLVLSRSRLETVAVGRRYRHAACRARRTDRRAAAHRAGTALGTRPVRLATTAPLTGPVPAPGRPPASPPKIPGVGGQPVRTQTGCPTAATSYHGRVADAAHDRHIRAVKECPAYAGVRARSTATVHGRNVRPICEGATRATVCGRAATWSGLTPRAPTVRRRNGGTAGGVRSADRRTALRNAGANRTRPPRLAVAAAQTGPAPRAVRTRTPPTVVVVVGNESIRPCPERTVGAASNRRAAHAVDHTNIRAVGKRPGSARIRRGAAAAVRGANVGPLREGAPNARVHR